MKLRQAIAVILKCNNKILLVHKVKNSDGSKLEPFWGLPTGGIEANETHEQAVIRELAEEASISAQPPFERVGEIEYEFPPHTQKSSGFWGQHVTVYQVKIDRELPIVSQDGEIDEGCWLDLDEAITLAKFENTKELLKKFRR